MLVVTPSGPTLDRKPRVISEIRKANVQRSPSLEGHPKLSGILNYYSDCLGIWTQRTVSVREGCLLVYEADCCPFDCTPARSYASLGRTATPIRLPLHSGYSDAKTPNKIELPPDLKYQLFGNKECNSLGRNRNGIYLSGGAEFRLPLRHLNLMPSNLAPRAFCLSYRENGNAAIPVAIFQALSQPDYERWVKTLAVEIMRQTPLDAIRFLDVLGIAAISTPNNSNESEKRKSTQDSTGRWDRSPSSEGSTTSADFITSNKSEETCVRSKKANIINPTFARRKLQMSDVESQSDRDEVDCVPIRDNSEIKIASSGRKSREKVRRSRDGFANGSSSEDTRAPDEGIVMEERCSSSERSCRRALWSSDRSDFLDSPRSISSYSSYEFGDSPDGVDVVDNVLITKKQQLDSRTKREPDRKFVPIARDEAVPSRNSNQSIKNAPEHNAKRRSPMLLYRARPFINEPSPEQEKSDNIKKDLVSDQSIVSHVDRPTPLIVVNAANPWDSGFAKGTKVWNRARSCSPNNTTSRSPPRFPSSGRPTRAFSVGQTYLEVPDTQSSVEALKQRCQNTENYVPVKEKLALFESLCRAGRLARSSEELAGIEKSVCSTPRARSLHDLTRSRSPQVPVREMCKFFETISNAKNESKHPKPVKHLYEKFNGKCCNRDKYLKHKRNDCSNINKDSAFDKSVHRQGGVDTKIEELTSDTSEAISNSSIVNVVQCTEQVNENMKTDELEDIECERSKYANFTQIRRGNKIITYV